MAFVKPKIIRFGGCAFGKCQVFKEEHKMDKKDSLEVIDNINIKNPMVHSIVEKYLKEHGYDGLYGLECGCKIGDLFPCGEYNDCRAGYKQKDCESYIEGGELPDFCIGPDKDKER